MAKRERQPLSPRTLFDARSSVARASAAFPPTRTLRASAPLSFQHLERGGKFARRNIFAGLFQKALQLLLLGPFGKLFGNGGVQRASLGVIRIGGDGVIGSFEGGIEIARSLGGFGAAHRGFELV